MDKKFSINGEEVTVHDYVASATSVSFTLNGRAHCFRLVDRKGSELVLSGEGQFKAFVSTANKDGESMVIARGREAVVGVAGMRAKRAGALSGGLSSPMPGKIFKLIKEIGSDVKKGEVILILEAMKMEHSIRADKDGKLKSIFFKTGDLVQGGVILAEVE